MSTNPKQEITVEELLSLLEETKETPSTFSHPFLEEFGINPGPHRVCTRHLKDLYRLWSGKYSLHGFDLLFTNFDRPTSSTILTNKTSSELSELIRSIINESYRKLIKKPKRFRKKHFINYLNYFNIERGNDFVLEDILFKLYDEYTVKTKARPVSRKTYTRVMQVFFERKVHLNLIYWAVNKTGIKTDLDRFNYLASKIQKEATDDDRMRLIKSRHVKKK